MKLLILHYVICVVSYLNYFRCFDSIQLYLVLIVNWCEFFFLAAIPQE